MVIFHRFFFVVVVVLFLTGGLVAIAPGDTGFGLDLFILLSTTHTVFVLLVQFFSTICPFGHLLHGWHLSMFFLSENVCPYKRNSCQLLYNTIHVLGLFVRYCIKCFLLLCIKTRNITVTQISDFALAFYPLHIIFVFVFLD